MYVLNAGGDGNIQGFWRSSTGILTQIAGSNQPLSQAAPGPAQVEFSPNGRGLVVTEKATNRITFYRVHADGSASAPSWRASAGSDAIRLRVQPQRHARRFRGGRWRHGRELRVQL